MSRLSRRRLIVNGLSAAASVTGVGAMIHGLAAMDSFRRITPASSASEKR